MPTFEAKTSERLDTFLSQKEGITSRTKAQKLIKAGAVTINGHKATKSSTRIRAGDRITITMKLERRTGTLELTNLSLDVLYEDTTCLVIQKPAGIAVHPAPSTGEEVTMLHGIASLFEERRASGAPLPFTPDAVLVHRLDKETTGCLLIAKTPEAHRALQRQFEQRTVQKTYLALVAGVPNPPQAVIDAPIGRNLLNRVKMSILRTGKSREARTSYRTICASDNCALLECGLHTGRTHQIRVHLRSIGHPILGDPTYALEASEKLSKEIGVTNLCLHAWKLAFDSPEDGENHEVVAPLPVSFSNTLNKLSITL